MSSNEMEIDDDDNYSYTGESVDGPVDDSENGGSNLDELYSLYNEASHMIVNNTKPSEGWYEDKFKYIYKYSTIDWDGLIARLGDKDKIIQTLATQIKHIVDDLMDDYGGKPDFDFNKYFNLLTNIINIWRYYSDKYMGDEKDSDILDLIEGMWKI